MPIYVSRFRPASEQPADPAIDLTDFDLVYSEDFDGVEGAAPPSPWLFFDGFGEGTWRDTVLTTTDAYQDGNGNLRLQARIQNGEIHTSYLETLPIIDPGGVGTTWDPADGDIYMECRFNDSNFRMGGPWWAWWVLDHVGSYDGNAANGGEFDMIERFISYGKTFVAGFPNGNSLNFATHNVHWGTTSDEKNGADSFFDTNGSGIDLTDGAFHTCQFRWTTTDMTVWVDGFEVFSHTSNVLLSPHHMRLSIEYDRGTPDQSDSDPWGIGEDALDYPDLSPSYVLIDSIKVWQKNAEDPIPDPDPDPDPDPPAIKQVIIDGDWGGDVDGIGSLSVLAKGMQDGLVEVKGIGCVGYEYNNVTAVDIIMKFYGHDLPIAKQPFGTNSTPEADDRMINDLVDQFVNANHKTVIDAPTTDTLFRQVLAAADNNSITVITNGPLSNIQQLLNTAADEISSLDGEALFNQKVTHCYFMGGRYPGSGGIEWNFSGGGFGAAIAQDVVGRITRPITFIPFQIGFDGSGYEAGSILEPESRTNPLVWAYQRWFEREESTSVIGDWGSWDIITTYIAIYGSDAFTPLTTGFNLINSDGSNSWETFSDADHTMITENMDPATFVSTLLNPQMIISFENKETSAPILTGTYNLTSTGITDALGTSLDTGSPNDLWKPNVGGRIGQTGGISDRHEVVNFEGKRAIKSTFRAGEFGYGRNNSFWLSNSYDEFGYRLNFWVPSDWDLVSSAGDRIGGKTMFALTCGPGDNYNPNAVAHNGLSASAWQQGGRDVVAWPDEQWGCLLKANMASRSPGNFEFKAYHHALGGRRNGTDNIYAFRDDEFSNLFNIQGWSSGTAYWEDGFNKPIGLGQWLRIEIYAKMDTNGMDGIWELWVNGTKWLWTYNLDFGGFFGDRLNDLPGSNWVQRGDGSGGIAPAGGGWGFHSAHTSDILGGPFNSAHIPAVTRSYYIADWALYRGAETVPPDPPDPDDPDPTTRTLRTNDPNLLAYPSSWQNNQLTSGAGTPNGWQAVQHNPTALISQCSLIQDSSFGYYSNGNPVRVMQTHMYDPTGTPVDVAAGNRGEILRLFDKNGNEVRRNVNSANTYILIAFYIDNDAVPWTAPNGYFTINQQHDSGNLGEFKFQGGPYHSRIQSNRTFRQSIRGGVNPQGFGFTNLDIDVTIPFNQWCFVIVEQHYSANDGSALNRLYYRYDSLHTSWQTGPESTKANRYIINGTPNAPYFKQGIYRANEVSNIQQPWPARIRSYLMVGTTFDSVVPFVEWL